MATESTQQGYGQRTGEPRMLPGALRTRGGYRRGRAMQPQRSERLQSQRLALGLGWFSIGLGVTQLVAPHVVARMTGTSRNPSGLIRLIGLRELACGLGILSQRNTGAWLQARVAGDLMDLALLAPALRADNPARGRCIAAAAAVATVAGRDDAVAGWFGRHARRIRCEHRR